MRNGEEECAGSCGALCAQHPFEINLYSILIKQLSINIAARNKSDAIEGSEKEWTRGREKKDEDTGQHNNGIYRL